MAQRRAQLSGRRNWPDIGSVERFAETVIVTRNAGMAFSMQVDRIAAPAGCEHSRAGH